MVDRRTMLRLLGASSVAASLELLGSDTAAAFEPFDFEPTTVNVLESLALRYQALYHSTPPTELMVPVSAHLELVDLPGHCLASRNDVCFATIARSPCWQDA